MEMLPGHEVEYDANFNAYIQDYPCDPSTADAYYFSLLNGVPFEYAPTHLPFVAMPFTRDDSVKSHIEDSLADIPIPKDIIAQMKDSAIKCLQYSNPKLLENLIKQGIFNEEGNLVDSSVIKNNHLFSDTTINYNDWVEIYPNPTRSKSNIGYQIFTPNSISIHLKNALGEDFSSLIEPFIKDQMPGKYKVIIHSENLTPGIYFVEISIGSQIIDRKLTVL